MWCIDNILGHFVSPRLHSLNLTAQKYIEEVSEDAMETTTYTEDSGCAITDLAARNLESLCNCIKPAEQSAQRDQDAVTSKHLDIKREAIAVSNAISILMSKSIRYPLRAQITGGIK